MGSQSPQMLRIATGFSLSILSIMGQGSGGKGGRGRRLTYHQVQMRRMIGQTLGWGRVCSRPMWEWQMSMQLNKRSGGCFLVKSGHRNLGMCVCGTKPLEEDRCRETLPQLLSRR